MSEQPDLFPPIRWTVPRAPYTGSSAATIESSRSGSDRVTPTHGKKAAMLLQVIDCCGALTLNEMHDLTDWPLSSCCSLRRSIDAELVEVDSIQQLWASGKATTRTRWKAR